MSAWVGQYEPLYVVCLWTKVHQIFLSNVEGAVVDQVLFGYAISLSHFGDSRDQSWKLSKIAPNFGRFFASQILGGRPSKTYTDFITPDSRHIIWRKFCEDTPTSPEVIGANTLNFKVNFKFYGLKFFGGTPLPVRMCARRVWPICSACKNFRAQHPLMAEI